MDKTRWIFFVIMAWFITSCDPIITTFDDIESAVLYRARNTTSAPANNSTLQVMTWNIRFGIGRLPFFGDSCGDRSIFTENEVMTTLDSIVAKINSLDPDIVLFQEIDIESKRTAYIDQVQWILDHTNLNYGAFASMWKSQVIPSDGIGRIDAGNAVLSKWKIERADRIQLPLRGDQDGLTQLFYLRRNILKAKITTPNQDSFYAVVTHSTAFATDNTKQKHIDSFIDELEKLDNSNSFFIAGGDLNSIPPGALLYDFCETDQCAGDTEVHVNLDGGPHREGSYFNNFDNEPNLLEPLYSSYTPAIPLDIAIAGSIHTTHSTDSSFPWDRKLDYIFTNLNVVENSGTTHQDTRLLSDHAPVTCQVTIP